MKSGDGFRVFSFALTAAHAPMLCCRGVMLCRCGSNFGVLRKTAAPRCAGPQQRDVGEGRLFRPLASSRVGTGRYHGDHRSG
jgi:hypothetical protein